MVPLWKVVHFLAFKRCELCSLQLRLQFCDSYATADAGDSRDEEKGRMLCTARALKAPLYPVFYCGARNSSRTKSNYFR